jgi:hypothetical protein
MQPKKDAVSPTSVGAPGPDAKGLENVREILHHLANTVSALKIFPPEHASVVHFVDVLTQRLKAYLDEHSKLEIGIEEFSFTAAGRPVFIDEMTIKSLPFFFFKDGMQALYFYQGLDREEIAGFLELIRQESQKPAGEGDIVTAMWERDFANIQYFAPDEFLEGRILEERSESQARHGLTILPAEFARDVIEVKVDPAKFTTGRITLTQQDQEDVAKGPQSAQPEEDGEATAAPAAPDGEEVHKSPAAGMDPTLTDQELGGLEAMLRASRTMSPDEEFLDLMIKVLFLATSAAEMAANLEALEDYHQSRLEEGNFAAAILVVNKIRELRDHLASVDPEKTGLLEAFLKKLVGLRTLDAVRGLVAGRRDVSWVGLVDFFRILGAPALPLAADIFDALDADTRLKVWEFLRAASAGEPGTLAGLADDDRPLLSKDVIGFLASAGPKALPHFSTFVSFRSPEIKLSAVDALGRVGGELANRLLLAFLNDPEEGVRIQAAMRLHPIEERSRILHIIREAGSRSFRAKSLKEKQAILSFLGRTQTVEALGFLRGTLRRKALWPSAGSRELRLAAVSGLESMGTGEAVEELEKGARSRTGPVREACSQALARLASAGRRDTQKG